MFKEQHIMQRSKEIQGQMRNKIVDMYQSGKSYKLVMQSLIYFGEPVLFEQFGSLNPFKKPIHWLLMLSNNDVTMHFFFNNSLCHVASMKHLNKVICVNTY